MKLQAKAKVFKGQKRSVADEQCNRIFDEMLQTMQDPDPAASMALSNEPINVPDVQPKALS